VAKTVEVRTPVDRLTTGRMTRRVEAKITVGMDEAIRLVATELAGGGDPRMFRSRAVRTLLAEAVRARSGSVRKRARG
jgi:hypothetical protein